MPPATRSNDRLAAAHPRPCSRRRAALRVLRVAASILVGTGRPELRILRIAACILVAALGWPAPAGANWVRPVSGLVTRPFEMHGGRFAPGQHRGADFAASPGTRVRAACGGRVVVAARIGSSGGVVTVACGRWRASHLPLGSIIVREGARISAGDPIGTSEASSVHAGLHLGVRRANDPDAYVDPLRFLHATPPPPVGPPPPRTRRRPGRPTPTESSPIARPVPAPATRRVPAPATRSVPGRATRSVPGRAMPRVPAPASRPVSAAATRRFPSAPFATVPAARRPATRPDSPSQSRPLAPWPAWAALAALLLAAGGGVRVRQRRDAAKRASAASVVAGGVR